MLCNVKKEEGIRIKIPIYNSQKENLSIKGIAKGGSERSKRRNQDKKRVNNQKIMTILNLYGGLKFESYREGLMDVLRCNKDKWIKP